MLGRLRNIGNAVSCNFFTVKNIALTVISKNKYLIKRTKRF